MAVFSDHAAPKDARANGSVFELYAKFEAWSFAAGFARAHNHCTHTETAKSIGAFVLKNCIFNIIFSLSYR